MPFRDKVKSAFRRHSTSSQSPDHASPASPALAPSPTVASTAPSTPPSESQEGEKKKKKTKRSLFTRKDPYVDWPDNVYKPHEVPPPKYRRAPDPEHSQHLQSFSFGDATGKIKRRSQQSNCSPGGTRVPSRNPSLAGSDGTAPLRGMSLGTAVAGVDEVEGDDDVANVGLSRQHTHESEARPRATSLSRTAEQPDGGALATSKTVVPGPTFHDQPFTEEELTRAMTSTTIRTTGTYHPVENARA